jgi:hypothetical protein
MSGVLFDVISGSYGSIETCTVVNTAIKAARG